MSNTAVPAPTSAEPLIIPADDSPSIVTRVVSAILSFGILPVTVHPSIFFHAGREAPQRCFHPPAPETHACYCNTLCVSISILHYTFYINAKTLPFTTYLQAPKYSRGPLRKGVGTVRPHIALIITRYQTSESPIGTSSGFYYYSTANFSSDHRGLLALLIQLQYCGLRIPHTSQLLPYGYPSSTAIVDASQAVLT